GVPGRVGSRGEDDPARLRRLGQVVWAEGLLQARREVLPQPPQGRGPHPPECDCGGPGRVDLFDADPIGRLRASRGPRKEAANVNGTRGFGRSVGVLLTPIAVRHPTTLEALRGRTIAVDGNLELYQFLSVMRTRDGTPLKDSRGRITSHLNGLIFRTTRLIGDHGIRPVFVFDGPPPDLKRDEIRRRQESREKSETEYHAALASGDMATAWSKAVMSSRLTRAMVEEAKTLLALR